MLVLPLGLGTKLRRVPTITLLVAAVWLTVFCFDRSAARISSGLLATAERSGVRDAARSLFMSYCKGRRGQAALCEKYAVLVWTGYPGREAPRADHSRQAAAALHPFLDETLRASRLRDELNDCGRSRSCLTYKETLASFMDAPLGTGKLGKAAAPLTQLPGFPAYHQAEHAYLSGLIDLCAANDCLIRGHITPSSLLWAQLRHGGLWHLLANITALLLFGIYVEQRGSRGLYLGVLCLGGTIGMAVYTAYFGANDAIVLGGSANVSAVMGMFYVFFFHTRMRFLVWLPRKIYAGSHFFAEVRYCFPLFFVLSDIAGGLDQGFGGLAGKNVAHVAHLVGFAVGMVAAYGVTRLRPVPAPLIYEDEVPLVQQLSTTKNLPLVFRLVRLLLRWNPENMPARELGCAAVLRSRVLTRKDAPLPLKKAAHDFLSKHLVTVCAVNARAGGNRFVCQLLSKMPFWVPLDTYLGRLGARSILRLADFALGQAHILLAIRLYDLYLVRFPLTLSAGQVEESAADAVARLPRDRLTVAAVNTYLNHHSTSLLAPRLGAWASNAERKAA